MAPVMGGINEIHGRGLNLFIISIAYTFFSILGTADRVTMRYSMNKKCGKDDLFIILATIFATGLGVTNCIDVYYGEGKDQAALPQDQIRRFLMAFYAAQILYKFSVNATKIAICCLYLRLFHRLPKLCRLVYWVMALVGAYAFSSILATVFMCQPISRFWDRSLDGTCIDPKKFWIANAVAFTLGDVVILILPMRAVSNMQMSRRGRWGLMFLFGLGGFTTLTSILRATTLHPSAASTDLTHGYLTSTIWTTIEVNTGIVCANLPIMQAKMPFLYSKVQKLCSRKTQIPSSDGSGSSRWPRFRPQQHDSSLQYSPSPAILSTNSNDIPMESITKRTVVELTYSPTRSSYGDGHSMGRTQFGSRDRYGV